MSADNHRGGEKVSVEQYLEAQHDLLSKKIDRLLQMAQSDRADSSS